MQYVAQYIQLCPFSISRFRGAIRRQRIGRELSAGQSVDMIGNKAYSNCWDSTTRFSRLIGPILTNQTQTDVNINKPIGETPLTDFVLKSVLFSQI